MLPSHVPHALLVAAAAVLLGAGARGQTTVLLDARAAWLHVNSDSATQSTPIALAPLGLAPGKCVRIRNVGSYDNGPGGDTFGSSFGVFSADATLLGPTLLHRVPGAIDAGIDVVTPSTFFGDQATDIPEDFWVSDDIVTEVTVQVPAGAAWLFVCAADHYFSDNSDPNHDWGVDLTRVGCWTDLGLGLAGAAGTPVLAGSGTLLAGDPLTLSLTGAAANSSAALVVGLGALNAPFKGGTLVPTTDVLLFGLPTDATGSLALSAAWPAGLPADFTLYFQEWIADATALHGFSASNGLSATTP